MTALTNKPSPYQIGTLLYGITRHHSIIPFEITKIIDCDNGDFQKLDTRLTGEEAKDSYAVAQHRLVFSDLFIFDDELNKGDVFLSRGQAKARALILLDEEAATLQRQLDTLAQQRITLTQET